MDILNLTEDGNACFGSEALLNMNRVYLWLLDLDAVHLGLLLDNGVHLGLLLDDGVHLGLLDVELGRDGAGDDG